MGIQLSTQGIEKVKVALNRKGWEQKDLKKATGLAHSTVSLSLNSQQVSMNTLKKIYSALELELEDGDTFDVDALVRRVRSHFHNEIQYRCGTLALLDDVFDTSWSVRLEDICIEDIKVKDESSRFASNQESQIPVHWREPARTKRRLMVLGKPGAGKTTLLQHIAIQCNEGKFRPELVPIFIKLKSFAEDARDAGGLSLLDYISQEYYGNGVSKQKLENLFQSGRTLILLDGLDEVPELVVNRLLLIPFTIFVTGTLLITFPLLLLISVGLPTVLFLRLRLAVYLIQILPLS